MSISIVCPSCATKLQAPSDKAGRKARCPKCGTKIAVASQGILEPARLVPLPQFIKPAEPPDRPEESAPVQTEDFSPPRRKYAIPSRAGLWIGLAVGAFAVVLTI